MTVYGTAKKRNLTFHKPETGVETSKTSGGSDYTNLKPCSIVGKQETYSWENSWYAMRKDGNLPRYAKDWDVGGEFYSVKNSYSGSHPWTILDYDLSNITHLRYAGPLFAVDSNVGPTSSRWPMPPGDLRNEMIAKGATAISNVIPTNPVANSAQMIGELREGIPKIPLSHLGRTGVNTKRFGDEYLNYQFGIAPMVSDFQDIAKAVKNSGKILRQLERDSGRRVRRRYDFPVETSTSRSLISSQAYASPSINTWLYKSSGTLYKETTTTRRFWFSGAFTYHYQTGDSLSDRLLRAEQSANKLFGARITPELFWELTPWSWAVDWVSNMGDVVHNLSAFTRDGLVMPYGYMMANVTITDTYTLHGISFQGRPVQTMTQSFTTEVKQRVKATPFGFGLDPVSFTPRQWAIVGALGLSRTGNR